MHARIRLASAIVALMAALLVAAPVAAASPWGASRQAGTNAYASNDACTDNADGSVTCQGASVDVFEGSTRESGGRTRKGEHACYGEYRYTYDPTTGETAESHGRFGCTFDAGTVAVDRLTSITLAPTVIELTTMDCDATTCTESPGGTTTVHGTWTGAGPIVSHKGRSRYDDGTCLQAFSDSGRFREASFDGSIEATSAQMADGTFTFKTDCAY